MNQDQIYRAASFIFRNQAIAHISSALNLPLIEAKRVNRLAMENKVPKAWYALLERTELFEFPAENFIPEAIR